MSFYRLRSMIAEFELSLRTERTKEKSQVYSDIYDRSLHRHPTPDKIPPLYPTPMHQTNTTHVHQLTTLPYRGRVGPPPYKGGGNDVQHRHSKTPETSQPIDQATLSNRSRCRFFLSQRGVPNLDKFAHSNRPLYYQTDRGVGSHKGGSIPLHYRTITQTHLHYRTDRGVAI